MRVFALNAPDMSITEERLRARFTPSPPPSNSSNDGDSKRDGEKRLLDANSRRSGGGKEREGDDEGGGERAVSLCMELVYGEGFGVAEEVNELLR